MPVVTYIIIAITCVTSYGAFNDLGLFQRYLFSPYLINAQKQWYRFFSHAFIHADFLHLAMNMYTLYLFGGSKGSINGVEITFEFLFGHAKGLFYYILLYVGGIMISSYPSFEKHKHNVQYSAVGASGAVSAVVFASILMYPTMTLRFFFLPIDIPAFVLGILYLVYSWYMARRGTDNIGHDAHFWGAVFGVVFTAAIKYQLLFSFVAQMKDYFGMS